MNHIACWKKKPFELLYYEKNFIKHWSMMNRYENKEYNVYETINSIEVLSKNEFFVTTRNSIKIYRFQDNNFRIKHVISIPKWISLGIFNQNNKMFYCVNDRSLYLIQDDKIKCTFPNIQKYLLDEYRFFSFPTNDFLTILKWNQFSIFSTKIIIQKSLQQIWRFIKSLKIKFHTIHKEKFVYIVENLQKVKHIVLFHTKSHLVEILNIEPFIQDYSFSIVSKYQTLFLIIFLKNVQTVRIIYYTIETSISLLFEHLLYDPLCESIRTITPYMKNNYHFILVNNNENQTFLKSLFHFYEKYTSELQLQYKNKSCLETQLNQIQKIIQQPNIRQENDTLIKTLGKCCICYENNVSVMFFPCNHICSCSNCGMMTSISNCPLCREFIYFRKMCYILTK